MRTQLAMLTIVLWISAACESSRTSTENTHNAEVTDLSALPDTPSFAAVSNVLANAERVLANTQRLLDDTAASAAIQRAVEHTAAVSALLDAQQSILQDRLQEIEEHQRTLFEHLERVQERLERQMRRQSI